MEPFNIELEFFKVFEIKTIEHKSCDVGTFCPYPDTECGDSCPYWRTYKVDYPSIHDHVLLDLLCLASRTFTLEFKDLENANALKSQVLLFLTQAVKNDSMCQRGKDKLKKAVRQILKIK